MMPQIAKPLSCILVVGRGPTLEKDDGAVALLRQLGAQVRALDLWEDFTRALDRESLGFAEEHQGIILVRALVFEADDCPDLAVASLRAARREPRLRDVPAIVQIPARQVARLEPSSGFDDFIVTSSGAAELYARIRALEWRRSEFSTDERLKMGPVVIDRAAQEVTLDGRRVTFTAREYALLTYLAANRGRVFSRDELLARVWGARYEGGRRTVDIHVRRLRAKLGEGLPLETMRGAGYKLRSPVETVGHESSMAMGAARDRAVEPSEHQRLTSARRGAGRKRAHDSLRCGT